MPSATVQLLTGLPFISLLINSLLPRLFLSASAVECYSLNGRRNPVDSKLTNSTTVRKRENKTQDCIHAFHRSHDKFGIKHRCQKFCFSKNSVRIVSKL